MVATHGNLRADPDDVIETIAPLDALPRRPDTPDGLAAAGRAAGLRVVEQLSVGGYARGHVAERVRRQHRDEVLALPLAGTVQPVIAALRRLPDPDRQRHQVWRVHLSRLDKP